MIKAKRILLAACTAILMLGQTVLGGDKVISAQTYFDPYGSAPSGWAAGEVQMIQVHGLWAPDSYEGYQDVTTGDELLIIESSLERKFHVADPTKVDADKEITRGDAVKEYYDIIRLAVKPEESAKAAGTAKEAADYAVKNGLISGRTAGDRGLDKPCTLEELLVIGKRVYDHIIYQLHQEARGAFWKVSDDNNTVYLLGSVHVTDGSVYPFNQEISRAFNSADALAVEANILNPSPEDAKYYKEQSILKGDQTIDKLLSKETYDAYVKAMESLDIPAEEYNYWKPWYAANFLTNVIYDSGGYFSSLGIDEYFLSKAAGVKPVIELEGLKYQADVSDSFSPELQESNLRGALFYKEENPKFLARALEIWKSGDMEQLEKLMPANSGDPELDKWAIR